MTTLTKGEQFIYDWQYGIHGATSFKGYLSKAMAVADNTNLDKLRLAFPEYADAMNSFHTVKGWWPRVEDIGNKDRLVILGKHPVQTNVATKKENEDESI
jgi:hypothetical protein